MLKDFKLKINGKLYKVKAYEDEPLLWVVRERLRLTGTKFGCGIGVCGACSLVRSQVEGAIIMGLSMALKEGVSFGKEGIKTTNLHEYGLLRMEEAPEIEVYILTSKRSMGGVGEPGLPPAAPALANALLWDYGIKINQLPIRI